MSALFAIRFFHNSRVYGIRPPCMTNVLVFMRCAVCGGINRLLDLAAATSMLIGINDAKGICFFAVVVFKLFDG